MKPRESQVEIDGLRCIVVESKHAASARVVLLHGYAMAPEDLAPFAHALASTAEFWLPAGPQSAQPSGCAWWAIDHARRAAALAHGPRDLAHEDPPARAAARDRLAALIDAIVRSHGAMPLVLAGFSQGGMLACDFALHRPGSVQALGLFSASRIALDDWTQRAGAVAHLPVLVSHGRADQDLAFTTGEGLRDFLAHAGAAVDWIAFDQGHVIPLVVWRRFRRLLASVSTPRARA